MLNWLNFCLNHLSHVQPGKKSRFSSLRVRLVGTVFLAVLAGWLTALVSKIELAGFSAGLLALFAAWVGGEWFIMKQVRSLLQTTSRLAKGDLNARTHAGHELGELGELARNIDSMANTLAARARESEITEQTIRNRAMQQTAVAALSQFAINSNNLDELIAQALPLVAQTLEVEFCDVLEMSKVSDELVMRDGYGWREGLVGYHRETTALNSVLGFVVNSQETVRVCDYRTDQRLAPPMLARYHGAVSSICVPIVGRSRLRVFGVLSVHSTSPRVFNDDDEQFVRAVANLLAMTMDRHKAEREIQKRAGFAQLNPTPAIEMNLLGEVTYANDAAFKLVMDVGATSPNDLLPPNIGDLVEQCLVFGEERVELKTELGGRTLAWLVHPVPDSQMLHCYITDVTEREKIEANLRQADKMLAIGQLASGVAHDFNNMLTVIQGHAGILMQKSERTGKSDDSAQAIYFAAERAAGLTRQLLMFSRKNVKQLSQLHLFDVVGSMSDMLERLIGENIDMRFEFQSGVNPIEGDRNEIEQVIMNFVVNARDAMSSGGGKLTINVDCEAITPSSLVLHPQAREGKFVRLRVSDTGCGMDRETIDRIFEPFFTTKEVGKGTGLGLATVYGIVKQHNGWIEVESEPGRGTTFNVYFPAVAPAAVEVVSPAKTSCDTDHLEGCETILVVEDEDDLRDMAVLILDSYGYKTLSANSGPEALKQWERHAGKIQMIVTDMVMPGGLNGLQLAEELISEKPTLPVVITSGYSMEDISDKVSSSSNIHFVQKPYNPTSLTAAIRNALDRPKKNTTMQLPTLRPTGTVPLKRSYATATPSLQKGAGDASSPDR